MLCGGGYYYLILRGKIISTNNFNACKISIALTGDVKGINRIRSLITLDNSNGLTLFDIESSDIEKVENGVMIVCHKHNSIIGYLSFHPTNIFNKDNNAMLEVYVEPDFQENNIGTKLLEYAIEYARKSTSLERLCLGVLHCNTRARRLYEKKGFSCFSEDNKGIYMAKVL